MIVVGIGEVAYSDDPHETIITHALGSCVAVVIHCVKTRKTALAHVVLPHQNNSKQMLKEAYFADVTLHRMLDWFLKENGCRKSYLKVHLIGGADSLNEMDQFQVGRRNVKALSDILHKNYIRFNAADTGEHYSRTVSVHVKNGKIKVDRHRMMI